MPRSHATSASPEKAAPGNRGVGPFVAPARRPDVCGPRFISTMPKETSMDFTKHPATTVLHSGYRSDPTTHAVAVPIYQRSEEHTSELQSLMRSSYAVFCLQKKKITKLEQQLH